MCEIVPHFVSFALGSMFTLLFVMVVLAIGGVIRVGDD